MRNRLDILFKYSLIPYRVIGYLCATIIILCSIMHDGLFLALFSGVIGVLCTLKITYEAAVRFEVTFLVPCLEKGSIVVTSEREELLILSNSKEIEEGCYKYTVKLI